jgi:hypothetical protein
VEDIKGGGAELLEEKNQLLQAILDCTAMGFTVRFRFQVISSISWSTPISIG